MRTYGDRESRKRNIQLQELQEQYELCAAEGAIRAQVTYARNPVYEYFYKVYYIIVYNVISFISFITFTGLKKKKFKPLYWQSFAKNH
jgi:hypothetical protein